MSQASGGGGTGSSSWPPQREARQLAEETALFGEAFDIRDGGLRRALPPSLLAGWPLLCVVVDRSEGGAGRSLVAARDVAAGEVVLVAEPWAASVVPEQRKKVCAVCLGQLPVDQRRVGRKGRHKGTPAGTPAAAAVTCGCGQDRYCSSLCQGSDAGAWHRQWACAGAQSIGQENTTSAHIKCVARLVLDTLLRGAFPQRSSAAVHAAHASSGSAAGASWHDGVLLLQSHVSQQSVGQQQDDEEVVVLVEAALQAQVAALMSSGEWRTHAESVPMIAGIPRQIIATLISTVQCNNFGVYDAERVLLSLSLFPAAGVT